MRSPRMQFAFLVARVVGIADPISWIDSVDPLVVDCWLESHLQNPLPDPWEQSASIAMEIYQLASLIAASKGLTLPERAASHWMPSRKTSDTAHSSPSMSIDQQIQWAEQVVTRGA